MKKTFKKIKFIQKKCIFLTNLNKLYLFFLLILNKKSLCTTSTETQKTLYQNKGLTY